MRVPGRATSWVTLTTLLLFAAGAGVASAVTSPRPSSTPRPAPTTSMSPLPFGNTSTTATLPTTTLPPPVEGIDAVDFLNSSDGYALFSEDRGGASCSLSVAATHDGGSTFSALVPLPSAAHCFPTPSMTFNNAGDGFVVDNDFVVTHDGGATWDTISTSGTVLSVIPLGRSVWMLQSLCPSTQNGTSCPLVLEESTDGGRTWPTRVNLPTSTTVGNGRTGPADGWSWLVRTSLNSAWVLVPVPQPLQLGETAGRGLLLHTADGGAHWQEQVDPCAFPNPSVSLLSEAPDGTLWSACANEPGGGSQLKDFARSTDGGVTWVPEAHCDVDANGSPLEGPHCSPGDTNGGYLNDLAGVSSTTAFMDGDRNDLEVTHDGGRIGNRSRRS